MASAPYHILVVDDDPAVRMSLALLLKQAGYVATESDSAARALDLLPTERFDLVLQDMNFSTRTSGDEGLSLLRQIKERQPNLPVILITAWGSVPLAVQGMKAGAADFITKPWTHEQILHSLGTVLGIEAARARAGEPPLSRAALDEKFNITSIIAEDRSMLRVLDIVGRVAATDAPVLITGESGTGKELIADAIWQNSHRRKHSLVKVNLAGLLNALFATEMFGHVKGAFTDAKQDREGRFEIADQGTLFLDEIGDLALSSQVKLLRVLQDRRFERVGSSISRAVDVRVISATNRDLAAAIEAGSFREDLFYRLNLISIHLPPLRERRADIPLLTRHYFEQACGQFGRADLSLTRSADEWLTAQFWPGNIRQLRQLNERTVLLATSSNITADDVSLASRMGGDEAADANRSGSREEPDARTLDEMEREMIRATLARFDGHITHTAEALGISRGALYRRMEKYGMNP